MAREIAVTFDYRCPFARNAHEAVVAADRAGTDINYRYVAFSLDQVHAEEGSTPEWKRDPKDWGTGTWALQYGIAVRDSFAEKFLDTHIALFAVRHDHGRQLGDRDVLDEVIKSVGLDVDAVRAEVESGRPLESLGVEHEAMVADHDVFGVPTFIEGDEAVFIRFMERGRVDDLERAVALFDWPRLNEFKRTKTLR